jgi:uncharacterized protein YjbI with pentapeptide repeats
MLSMANDEHVALLKQGAPAWNAWRDENPDIRVDLVFAGLSDASLQGANLNGTDLSEADLTGVNLREANLSRADLMGADLRGADLREANLSGANLSRAYLPGAILREAILGGADLSGADLSGANLFMADLSGANLVKANLANADLNMAWLFPRVVPGPSGESIQNADFTGANLSGAQLIRAKLDDANLSEAILVKAILSGADLSGANLSKARLNEAVLHSAMLVNTDLTGADLTGCNVFGVSAWGLKLDEATRQQDLIVTPEDAPEITVDNIEVAQFVYLLLHNVKIRDVIDTITSKAVLILGRFTDERKAVLDALREELRKRDYLPILFDFAVPAARDITETVSLLARMARFIIADLTDPSSIPKELEAIVPDLAVPVQPLLEGSSRPYAMFKDYWKYDWVLPVYRYEGLEPLLATLAENVIAPAEAKLNALQERRRKIEAELTKPQ